MCDNLLISTANRRRSRPDLTLLSLFVFFLVLSKFSSAQQLTPTAIKTAAKDKFTVSIFDLKSFLSLPNDGHFPDQVKRNLKWCDSVFSDLNFDIKQISTEGAPLLFAEKKINKKL